MCFACCDPESCWAPPYLPAMGLTINNLENVIRWGAQRSLKTSRQKNSKLACIIINCKPPPWNFQSDRRKKNPIREIFDFELLFQCWMRVPEPRFQGYNMVGILQGSHIACRKYQLELQYVRLFGTGNVSISSQLFTSISDPYAKEPGRARVK